MTNDTPMTKFDETNDSLVTKFDETNDTSVTISNFSDRIQRDQRRSIEHRQAQILKIDEVGEVFEEARGTMNKNVVCAIEEL
ncbi:hypothetical protein Bca4012_003083 [Brassica carinata]